MSQSIIGALRVVLSTDSAAYEEGLDAAQRSLTKFGKSMDRIGQRVSGIGQTLSLALTVPIIAFGAAGLKAAKESADALGQVEASFKSMGAVSGKTLAGLEMQADQLMKSSLFDDEDVLRDLTANLLTFGNVAGPVFDRAQVAIVDLATKMKMDLQAATILVGKALNDPIKGLTALGRSGIQFSDGQKALIKSLVKTGQTAKAQAIILAELERQYGGSAAAAQAADSANRLADALDSLSESIGKRLLPLTTPMIEALTVMVDRFTALPPVAQGTTLAIIGLAAAIGPALIGVGAMISAVGKFGPLLLMTSNYARTAATSILALSASNLRLTFATTALSAAFMGQNTAMALMAATARTVGLVVAGLGRTLLALVGGPLGLAIVAIALLALNVGKADRDNKRLVQTMGGASTALDEYEKAALEAATATGEHRKEAAKNAATMRQEALDAVRAARALRERTAALAAAAAEEAERRIPDIARDAPFLSAKGVTSGLYEGAIANAAAARDRAKAANEGAAAAEKRLKEIERNISAVAAAANVATIEVGDLGDATKKGADKAFDYAEALRDMKSALSTDVQREVDTTRERIALLTKGLEEGKYSAYEVAQALRMINEERERAGFGKTVEKVDQSFTPEESPFADWTSYRGQVMPKEAQEELRRETSDAFRGGFEALRYGGAAGVMEYLANRFSDKLLYNLADQLTDLFDTLIAQLRTASSTGGGGGWMSSLASLFGGGSGSTGGFDSNGVKIPGFANEGGIRVGGTGGIDSQMVMMRATPNENISVFKANGNARSGGSTNVFDMRGAVVTQDLLDQMNQIAARGDAEVAGAFVKAQSRRDTMEKRKIGRGS